MSKTVKGQAYAVGSGILAALASLCGKYAMAGKEVHGLCEDTLEMFNDEIHPESMRQTIELCDQYAMSMRLVFFILMFGVNCIMWTTFTKALRFSRTSLEATITNTAANFLFTAIIGQVFLKESVTGLWWMGTVLIICGLLLMHEARNPPPRKPGTRKKKL